jgi:hypothetical protein
MTKHYNQRESFEALLRGETVVDEGSGMPYWMYETGLRLTSPGGVCIDSTLFSRGSTPYNTEPNPHPVGTFNWARHENKTKTVSRGIGVGFGPTEMECWNWSTDAIDATDWRLA